MFFNKPNFEIRRQIIQFRRLTTLNENNTFLLMTQSIENNCVRLNTQLSVICLLRNCRNSMTFSNNLKRSVLTQTSSKGSVPAVNFIQKVLSKIDVIKGDAMSLEEVILSTCVEVLNFSWKNCEKVFF